METLAVPSIILRLFFLVLAGGLGAVSRYALSAGLNSCDWCGKPWGVLICNLIGCFLFGVLSIYLTRNFTPDLKLIVLTGFLGAFTTFSTFIFDTVDLLEQSRYAAAAANLVLHNLLGIMMVLGGVLLGRTIS